MPPRAVCHRMAISSAGDIDSKIKMQGIHIELTPKLQNAIRDKFSILLRHNEWIVRVDVRLHLDQAHEKNHRYTATGQIVVRGPDIVASVKGEDAHAVLDGLVEKLDELLRERHGLKKDKRNHPHGIELEADLPKVEAE